MSKPGGVICRQRKQNLKLKMVFTTILSHLLTHYQQSLNLASQQIFVAAKAKTIDIRLCNYRGERFECTQNKLGSEWRRIISALTFLYLPANTLTAESKLQSERTVLPKQRNHCVQTKNTKLS